LHETEEEFAAALGLPTIEAKRELIQVVREVLVRDGPLMGSQQPALQQRGNPVDTRHQLGGILPPPAQSGDLTRVAFAVQTGVTLPTIGVNRAARFDTVLHEGMKATG